MKTPCFVIAEFPTSSYCFILTQPSSFVFNSPPRWRQHQRRLKTANKSKPATSPHLQSETSSQSSLFSYPDTFQTREIHDFPVPSFPFTDQDSKGHKKDERICQTLFLIQLVCSVGFSNYKIIDCSKTNLAFKRTLTGFLFSVSVFSFSLGGEQFTKIA